MLGMMAAALANFASESGSSGKRYRRPSRTFYIGLGVYGLSFLLPAMRSGKDLLPGWGCAVLSLTVWANAKPNLGGRLALFGGLINPAAVTYAAMRILGRATSLRWALAITILFWIPLTWLSLYFFCHQVAGMCPTYGHAVWIAGLLLMISGDAWRRQC
jgi:hypothetical protein